MKTKPMLARFSLYGFLKNQRYFEPFFWLALLEKGLSFFEIGLLVTIRELTVVILEIPSGAIADTCGRRGSMILSFVAYLISFSLLGWGGELIWFIPAMFCYGVGDAFRSGTHKAMIFAWLKEQGREDDRTTVYGYTRSWSKLGSAFSVVIAAIFVFVSNRYTYIFYLALIPYALNIINFMGYPSSLEGSAGNSRTPRAAASLLRKTLAQTFSRPNLRRLIMESMSFEGFFESIKDFLQPVLKAAALSLAVGSLASLSAIQKSSLLVGPIYLVLFLLSAVASRQAHRFTESAGGMEAAARRMWALSCLLYVVIAVAGWHQAFIPLMGALVLLHILQNMWRPILISRFDSYGDESGGATLLSIESMGKRTATMVLAPLLGLAVDMATTRSLGGPFWPVGIAGLVPALAFYITSRKREEPSQR